MDLGICGCFWSSFNPFFDTHIGTAEDGDEGEEKGREVGAVQAQQQNPHCWRKHRIISKCLEV